MADNGRNPIGTPEQCAAAAYLITSELLAQADEIRANWWDYHPRANLPEDRSLVAYADGIWIVETGGVLDELVRYARVADSWPVHLVYGGIRIVSDGRGEIPVPGVSRHAPLRLLAQPDDIVIAEVPAPVGGWDHVCLAAALEAQRNAVAATPAVLAMLGPERLGTAAQHWSLRP